MELFKVPGSFRFVLAVSWPLGKVDAVVCLGTIIRGDSRLRVHRGEVNKGNRAGHGDGGQCLGIVTADTLEQAMIEPE